MADETTADPLTEDSAAQTAPESAAVATATDFPDAEAQITALQARLDEVNDAFLRSRADFANFRRRTDEEKENLRQYLIADLLTRLLPILDNFQRALAAAAQTRDFDKLVGGVEGTYRQINDLLAREGVTPIDALHQPFDPNLHNAVLREESGDYPENLVVEELQKGYTLQGRVLRPTLVKVATGGG